MASEYMWRKFPRNAPRNVELEYVAELAAMKYADKPYIAMAPLQMYTIAYCMADDDGIVDFGDGIIISRMMQKLIAPDEIFYICNLLAQRNVFTHVCDHVYSITDWIAAEKENYPRKAQTADERRAAVIEKIRRERAAAKKQAEAEKNVAVDFDRIKENVATDFFCGLNDKNAENVATDRKIDRQTETESEKDQIRKNEKDETGERETRPEERERGETHTEERTPPLLHGSYGVGEARKRESEKQEDIESPSDCSTLAKLALQQSPDDGQVYQERKKQSATRQVAESLGQFFAKKNLGYTVFGRERYIAELVDRIMAVSSPENPPGMVANVICGQFEKLVQTEGYYKGMALLPENLLKNGPYATVLQAVSRILANRGNHEAWDKEVARYMQQADQIHNEVDEWMEAEFRRYGVDPNDPQRQLELLRARNAEKNAG